MEPTLLLAKDGIFPITKDKDGNPLPILPASGFNFPGTIQGEGKLNGIPSLFIRLAGCNLRCSWTTDAGNVSICDTAHASFRVKDSFKATVNDICNIVRYNSKHIDHLVITGGEPFLQSEGLIELCNTLKEKKDYHITIETNGSLYHEKLADCIDLFSLSPKLGSSTPPAPYDKQHNDIRINPKYLQAFITHTRRYNKDFQLKFVYAAEQDIAEIKSLLLQLKGWKNEDILLMPLGGNQEELNLNTQKTLEHCILNGWRYCDRLHISLFGAKHGV